MPSMVSGWTNRPHFHVWSAHMGCNPGCDPPVLQPFFGDCSGMPPSVAAMPRSTCNWHRPPIPFGHKRRSSKHQQCREPPKAPAKSSDPPDLPQDDNPDDGSSAPPLLHGVLIQTAHLAKPLSARGILWLDSLKLPSLQPGPPQLLPAPQLKHRRQNIVPTTQRARVCSNSSTKHKTC